MSQRRAVTKAMALRYRSASRADKAVMLTELCALAGWHSNRARKALRSVLGPKRVGRNVSHAYRCMNRAGFCANAVSRTFSRP